MEDDIDFLVRRKYPEYYPTRNISMMREGRSDHKIILDDGNRYKEELKKLSYAERAELVTKEREKQYNEETKATKPDWNFWEKMPTVKLHQACALAFNVDPDKLIPVKEWQRNKVKYHLPIENCKDEKNWYTN